MPELMDDELAAAFAEFRREALRVVRPAELAQVRAGAQAQRRREVTSRSALGAVVTIAVAAAGLALARPIATAPVDPPRPLTVTDVVGRPVNLPQWPDVPDGDSDSCPRGRISSAFQQDGPPGPFVNIKSVATVDVDRDRRPDLVAALSCRGPRQGDVTIEQVVAFSREAGGAISVIGQVTTTNGDARTIGAVMGGPGEGAVTVRFNDYPEAAASVARTQDRTFAFDGTAFRQVAGPTQFGPNPDLVNLDMTVEPLVLRPTADGGTAGTLEIVLRSAGPGRIESVELTILAATGIAFPYPACTKQESDPGDDLDPFGCHTGSLAPGDERVLSYAVMAPAGVTVKSLTVIAAAISPKGPLAEARLDDNFAEIPVALG